MIPRPPIPRARILAIDAESGRELWENRAPTRKATRGRRWVRGTAWSTAPRSTGLPRPATGAAALASTLPASCAAVRNVQRRRASRSRWCSRTAPSTWPIPALPAFRLADGAGSGRPARTNHHKAPDVFLAAGVVWTACGNGLDPETGQVVKQLDQEMTGPMGHDRCYRNRITNAGTSTRSPAAAISWGWTAPASFPIRGSAAPAALASCPATACSTPVRRPVRAATGSAQRPERAGPEPGLKSSGQPITVAIAPQLAKGPAYAATIQPPPAVAGAGWPTYRQDASRSGHTSTVVPAMLQPRWQTKFATHASPPVIAAGQVFAADVDAHAVCALNAADGKMQWTYTTGGRVDSPPTWHQGRLLFGSRDGWVYCLRATDGALVWRFNALPDRRMCAYEQVESAWPVCGSILVYHNVAYFVAGRNSFLDGGLFLFGLDPQTGRVLHQRHLYGPYGENGQPVISPETAVGATGAGGIQGNKGDILLAEDGHLFLRHEAFTPDLKSVSSGERIPPHLITSHGFIEPIPHHRSWWTIDTILRYDIPTGEQPGAWRHPGPRRHTVLRSPRVPAEPDRILRSAPERLHAVRR